MKIENRSLRMIRHNRNLSLIDFSKIIGISKTYLFMLEKGDRELTEKVVNKVEKAFQDLSLDEKHELHKSLEINIKENPKKTQKLINSLISQFFYYIENIRNGVEEFAKRIKDLAKEIIDLVSSLSKKDWTAEMNIFAGMQNI